MIIVHILAQCEHYKDEAYLPCPQCQGSGNQAAWVSLAELVTLLKEIQCSHEHTSFQGGFHFTAGDVWDDITEVCDDCGANLDKQ